MFTALQIIDKYLAREERLLVAKAVLLSQDIRESSWNGHKYETYNSSAAAQAVAQLNVDPFWANVISDWNVMYYDEIQKWSKDIVNGK